MITDLNELVLDLIKTAMLRELILYEGIMEAIINIITNFGAHLPLLKLSSVVFIRQIYSTDIHTNRLDVDQ